MIDSDLKPWLLEVNLSPSLNCDTPIDMKIKSALLCDLLNLIGIPAVDPVLKRAQFNQKVINMTQQEEANRLRMSKRPVSMETRRFAAIRLAASSTSLNQVQVFGYFQHFLALFDTCQRRVTIESCRHQISSILNHAQPGEIKYL